MHAHTALDMGMGLDTALVGLTIGLAFTLKDRVLANLSISFFVHLRHLLVHLSLCDLFPSISLYLSIVFGPQGCPCEQISSQILFNTRSQATIMLSSMALSQSRYHASPCPLSPLQHQNDCNHIFCFLISILVM